MHAIYLGTWQFICIQCCLCKLVLLNVHNTNVKRTLLFCANSVICIFEKYYPCESETVYLSAMLFVRAVQFLYPQYNVYLHHLPFV